MSTTNIFQLQGENIIEVGKSTSTSSSSPSTQPRVPRMACHESKTETLEITYSVALCNCHVVKKDHSFFPIDWFRLSESSSSSSSCSAPSSLPDGVIGIASGAASIPSTISTPSALVTSTGPCVSPASA